MRNNNLIKNSNKDSMSKFCCFFLVIVLIILIVKKRKKNESFENEKKEKLENNLFWQPNFERNPYGLTDEDVDDINILHTDSIIVQSHYM